MDLTIKQATSDDIDALIAVQDKSFYADYVKYGECPGYNHSRDSMTGIVATRDVYKICYGETIIGDIIVRDNGNDAYFLGCICIVPEYQGKGFGTVGMWFLKQTYPQARRWSLETPSDHDANHHFYKKHGFEVTKEYLVGGVKIVLFEKAGAIGS
jgi:ribosomal protein S18 acetylase RimI-like enzyme